ncbi:MAG: DUF3052 family protein [Burkholderiales bacterium]|nr:DUF3052 family protein [Burkholderiales bacterium]
MSTTTSAGYSGTPLAKKLGIKSGAHVATIGAPDDYLDLLQPVPADVVFTTNVTSATHLVHVFSTDRQELATQLTTLRQSLAPDATVWVSWPKKASKVPSSVTEDVIRELALPLGFVDVKVCAVDEIWSGLKLVVRKALRP